eukprot:gnl/TRDRNA2_/TRDRNA2_177027_c0_seq16.p1 gnl/TRDRNA2_/TRDRNA2_177027_c0~~gnl/TRDRNA2_/TRDRNA2_177027_c0_seq16.p1  ORF type:complete len:315 (-),score=60.96 gnl/TRDRNA2_/TRDRNA2_177027_c0_seq16:302-1246(-)
MLDIVSYSDGGMQRFGLAICLLLGAPVASALPLQAESLRSRYDEPLHTCNRVDIRDLPGGTVDSLTLPTVLTNVLEGSAPGAWDKWAKDAFLQAHASDAFEEEDFKYHGLGDYLYYNFSDYHFPGDKVTLGQIMSMDQPGNFVSAGKGGAGNRVNPMAKQMILQAEAAMPKPLAKVLESYGTQKHLSIGRNRQWNPVHRHATTIFTQVKGTKGWVLAKRDMPAPINTDFRTPGDLCHLFDHDQAKHNTNLTVCELHEGESLFFPGQGDDGWHHGTCNLADWSAGFAFLGIKDPLDEALLFAFQDNGVETVDIGI